ncbi:unnamed protein product [Symbiodinium pilosum]|uniref:Calmodulin n=1 Tax=Symbiodinium pilosum TaxID=2952 RepID=A0A812TBY1_SYMPI|nr:unnamed protein product [Symbiodinium pilosum]
MPVADIDYKEYFTAEKIADLKESFDSFDSSGDGRIGADELDHIFRKLGFPMKSKQLRGLLRDFDSDSSGEIDFEEFCVMMLRLKCAKQMRSISPETYDCRSLWLDEGFTAKELQRSGYGIAHMKAAGISVRQILAEAEVTALEMRRCGFSAQELRKAGMGASELRAAGFSLADLRLAGFSHAVLQTTNKTLRTYLSKGNLTVLPQQNPKFDPKRKKHTPFMKLWWAPKTSEDPKPVTPRIREHTDYRPKSKSSRPATTGSTDLGRYEHPGRLPFLDGSRTMGSYSGYRASQFIDSRRPFTAA